MRKLTLILPYYRAPLMLMKQLQTIRSYPPDIWTVIVDDCSKEPASEVVLDDDPASLYRIDTDIPWNREGARNLGAHVAKTDWIIQTDIDHVLPLGSALNLLDNFILLNTPGSDKHWYRFPRFRVGRADETRRKDTIPDDQSYGQIKPHIDSYLCTRHLYWLAGGYNEDYSGCLGGGGQFLKLMKLIAGEPILLPQDVHLEVYTRHSILDASVSDLSRDKAEYKKRKQIYGCKRAENPLRFEWHQIQ